MQKITKFKLRFNRTNKKLKKTDKARVSIEVYFDRSCRRFIPTDVMITKDQWDEKEKIVNSKNDNHIYLNHHLAEIIKGLKQYELELSVKGKTFTPDFLELYVKGTTGDKAYTFNQFWKEKMVDEAKINPQMAGSYKRVINLLDKFNPNIRFSEINYQLIKDLDIYMIEKPLKISSRANIHNIVKKFLHLCLSCDLLSIKEMPYNTRAGGSVGKFTINNETGDKPVLNFEERERIEKLEYPNSKSFEKHKDAFLFACYTGLRCSDQKSFNISHLVHTKNGYSIDLQKMIKTKRPVYLELFTLFDGKPEKILRKYLIKKFGTDDYERILAFNETSPLFGKLSNQPYNDALKKITRDAKIQKHITSHSARRTFGTHMAILSNGNQYLVMDLMGHTNPDTTLIYVRLGERMINKQLRNVNWTAYDPTPIESEINGDHNSEKAETTTNDNVPIAQPSSKIIEEQPSEIANEISNYINSEIIPGIKTGLEESIPFALNFETIQQYAGILPLSMKDLKKFQKKPFELEAYIIGMKFSTHLTGIQEEFDRNEWLKDNLLRINLKFLPMKLNNLELVHLKQ